MIPHEIKISVTPVCTSCGADLSSGGCVSAAGRSHDPFYRDDPWNRTTQRVFVAACPKCYVYSGDADALKAALSAIKEPTP